MSKVAWEIMCMSKEAYTFIYLGPMDYSLALAESEYVHGVCYWLVGLEEDA